MGRLRARLPSLNLFQVCSWQGTSGGPYASLAQAKGQIASGDVGSTRQTLESVLEIWSRADEEYLRQVEAQALLASL
ncbi:MAG: hypothetical protein HOI35_02540 [Woeseia sp.]|jgi:hypothetical protein|nr:hypothetical protein [Woeseia sp.]MBT6208885.1 hypothetical protein [Woeseia sp.]